MANNPHGSYHENPRGSYANEDPAGSTQMFRAFVDEGAQRPQPSATGSSGTSRTGLIIGVIAVLAVAAVVAVVALG